MSPPLHTAYSPGSVLGGCRLVALLLCLLGGHAERGGREAIDLRLHCDELLESLGGIQHLKEFRKGYGRCLAQGIGKQQGVFVVQRKSFAQDSKTSAEMMQKWVKSSSRCSQTWLQAEQAPAGWR